MLFAAFPALQLPIPLFPCMLNHKGLSAGSARGAAGRLEGKVTKPPALAAETCDLFGLSENRRVCLAPTGPVPRLKPTGTARKHPFGTETAAVGN